MTGARPYTHFKVSPSPQILETRLSTRVAGFPKAVDRTSRRRLSRGAERSSLVERKSKPDVYFSRSAYHGAVDTREGPVVEAAVRVPLVGEGGCKPSEQLARPMLRWRVQNIDRHTDLVMLWYVPAVGSTIVTLDRP